MTAQGERPRIVICDDEPGRVEDWVKKVSGMPDIADRYDVIPLAEDLIAEVHELERRRAAARAHEDYTWDKRSIDRADILIIDYDLLQSDAAYLTGEAIAYLARCYSECGVIVALNQFGSESAFDLTLRGHPESFADLNLAGGQFANGGLWAEPWKGFRPWVWPLLPNAADRFRRLTAQVASTGLDCRVVDLIGMPPLVVEKFPRTFAEVLVESEESIGSVTLDEVARSPRMGLRPKDEPPNDAEIAQQCLARIAVARISKWLERVVLPAQDLLVDAPHLVSRYPELLGTTAESPEAWEVFATLSIPEPPFTSDRVAEAKLSKSDWLSRAAWWGDPAAAAIEDPDVALPSTPDIVFAEDASRFVPRDCTRQFVADVESPFVQRFVIDPERAAGLGLDRNEFDSVMYRPRVRLTL
jgi:hypothetical protein